MDELFELVRTPLYGDFRVSHALQLLAVFLVLRALWRFVRPAPSVAGSTTAPAACGCGWRGQASRHAPRCPRCGNPAVLQ